MANDLKITPDQLEEPMMDEGKVNVNLTLYDNQLKEMASRTSLYQHISENSNADVTFEDLLKDDDTTMQAHVNFYYNQPPETILSLQSDSYGWVDFAVPTNDAEKAQLKTGFEAAAKKEHTSADVMMYESFKEEWIADHIDEATMEATKQEYLSGDEMMGLPFDQYVEEFGFSDGSAFPSIEEFLNNDYTERPTESVWAETQRDVARAVQYFYDGYGNEPVTTDSGTFTVTKSPEGDSVQLIDNDLKEVMAEMVQTDYGIAVRNVKNEVVENGIKSGLYFADKLVVQENAAEKSTPENQPKQKQSVERD